MCLMQSNATADEGFQEIRRSGDRSDYETRLALLAADDSQDRAAGLECLLEPVSSWRHNEQLRQVRKYRIGRHRFYIAGRNTQCAYVVCYVKVFKKKEKDPEEDMRFQRRILNALTNQAFRVLRQKAEE